MKKDPRQKSIEEEYGIRGADGKPISIPVRGSMGLLMMGYRGLMAWRAKRIEAANAEEKNNESQ